MSSPYDRLIKIELFVQSSHPELLRGLDTWLRLGLVSDTQVKQLCDRYLICPLPDPIIIPLQEPEKLPVLSISAPKSDFIQPPSPPPTPSFLSQLLHSFMAELSVRWLLFLGVFMVVISSGVLAASQWERFPASGQYGVLLAYTLTFWAVSVWSSRQSQLQLTTRTLRLVTLLLVPINFWAMDRFGLWQNPWDWAVLSIGTVILTFVTRLLFQPDDSKLPLLNHLGLSYLHWGWAIPGFPLIAIYLGVIGTSFITFYQNRQKQVESTLDSPESPLVKVEKSTILIVYALAILIGRGIFVSGVDISQLGLALGICGALIAWLDRRKILNKSESGLTQFPGEIIGVILLSLGWLVSVWDVPWQALAVSGLLVWFFNSRLLRYLKRRDLAILYGIGFQSIFLAWRIIPTSIQNNAIAFLTSLTNSNSTPWAIWSILLFPYLLIIVRKNYWLYRHVSPRLAFWGDAIALIFGISLTLVSLVNPSLSFLILLASTSTLTWVTKQYLVIIKEYRVLPSTQKNYSFVPNTKPLVYLTHIAALLTIISGTDNLLPNLNTIAWVAIFLLIMVAEWGVLLIQSRKTFIPRRGFGATFTQSCWYLGLALAGLSYLLLQSQCSFDGGNSRGCLLSLVTPIALTIVAKYSSSKLKIATNISVIALVFAQYLTITNPTIRIFSLGVATGLMLINTKFLPNLFLSVITVGFGLSFAFSLLYQGVFGFPNVAWAWFVAIAIAQFFLWYLRASFYRSKLHYSQAVDGWAIALCSFTLPSLIINSFWLNQDIRLSAIATVLIMVAAAYRSWQIPRSSLAIGLSILVLAIAQIPLFSLSETRLVGLGVATVLMFVHTHYLQRERLAKITVGFSLGFLAAICWEISLITNWVWGIIGAIALFSLWFISHQLQKKDFPISNIYSQATQSWGNGICLTQLVSLTIHSYGLYQQFYPPDINAVLSVGLTLLSLAYRYWLQPQSWLIYSLGWGIELLIAETLGFTGHSIISLAVANIILGLSTQILGDWWRRRNPDNTIFLSLHLLPLFYAILGVILRWGTFSNWTGLITLGVSLIAIGVGRRNTKFKPLLYMGLIGVSVSAYELVIYQMLQASGGATGDGLIIFAAVGTSILYAYCVLFPWLKSYLNLTRGELKAAAHFHWGWSSLLLLSASLNPITMLTLGLGTGAFLVQYAIIQGRNHPIRKHGEIWVYLGLLEVVGIRIYWLTTPLAQYLGGPLAAWKGAVAAIFAYFLYLIPWERWGWSKRPWKLAAIAIPLYAIIETRGLFHPLSLLVAAAFYLFIAWDNRQIRFSYISLLLTVWTFTHWFQQLGLIDLTWYVTPFGLALLTIIQIDPFLKLSEQKSIRHQLRLLGMGIVCLSPLLLQSGNGLVAGGFGILAIAAGLSLRIRAFLYIGTAVFLINAFYQLVVLIFDYSFIKWIVGLLVGIVFIWIAATFETRREQINTFLRRWMIQFQEWE